MLTNLKKCVFVLLLCCLCLSGCALLQIPGAIIGGTFKLLGAAFELAQKVPWWMWI